MGNPGTGWISTTVVGTTSTLTQGVQDDAYPEMAPVVPLNILTRATTPGILASNIATSHGRSGNLMQVNSPSRSSTWVGGMAERPAAA
jgi:hypothetical protein